MKSKVSAVFAAALVLVTGVTGCAESNNTSTNTINTTKVSQNGLTNSKVITEIRNTEKDHNVNNIQIISMKNIAGQGFSFASFDLDGQLKYANIVESPEQGTGIGVFSAGKGKGMPLQSTEQVLKNGFNQITGVVVDTTCHSGDR